MKNLSSKPQFGTASRGAKGVKRALASGARKAGIPVMAGPR